MMSNSSGRDIAGKTNGEQANLADEGLGALRQLLVGQEQDQLAHIQERLDDPELHAEDVSRVLPEAIVARTAQDGKLARALAPTIEEAFQVSIKRNPRALVDVISPLMGPAIRRSIFQTINGMVQSFNQALEHSVSIQGLKWRLEAFRTGVPFAEVVLLHTLVYQVEQIFLIHKETGLLLQHIVAGSVEAMDADMVSGMLTAIQDFVHDSFGGERDEGLQTMQVGERLVWVEQGPQAVVAGVIRGNPPQELRGLFQEALESVHLEQKEALENFQGDSAPFEASRPTLEECLQAQYKRGSEDDQEKEKEKTSPFVWVVPGVLVVALGCWIFWSLKEGWRWTDYLERLHAEPGIVVTMAEKRDGKYFVTGLRDPLALDPALLLQEGDLQADEVVAAWEPYQSFYPGFILQRTERVLQPPQGVVLQLENEVLHAVGTASHRWIEETRKLVRALPGIVHFDEEDLVDVDLKSLEMSRREVESRALYFARGQALFVPGQERRLSDLAVELDRLYDAARVVDKKVSLEIIGHTDESGTEGKNKKLSLQRAGWVLVGLIEHAIKPIHLTTLGMGSEDPARRGSTEEDRRINRRVSFKVSLIDVAD
jgi:outer membrane protein OmpA-like peptidoglycan-associated protein